MSDFEVTFVIVKVGFQPVVCNTMHAGLATDQKPKYAMHAKNAMPSTGP